MDFICRKQACLPIQFTWQSWPKASLGHFLHAYTRPQSREYGQLRSCYSQSEEVTPRVPTTPLSFGDHGNCSKLTEGPRGSETSSCHGFITSPIRDLVLGDRSFLATVLVRRRAAPVQTSTGTNFARSCREFPELTTNTGGRNHENSYFKVLYWPFLSIRTSIFWCRRRHETSYLKVLC